MTASSVVRSAKESGAKLYREGRYPESIAQYSIAISHSTQSDGELHLYYSNRSACYLQLHEYEAARGDAEICTNIKSTWPKGYVRLGKSLRNLGKIKEAISAFERAAELDPSNSDTVASLESLRELLNGKKSKNDTSDDFKEHSFRTQNNSRNIPCPNEQQRNNSTNVPTQNERTSSFDWKAISTTIQKYLEIAKMWCIKLLAKILSLSPDQSMYLGIAVVAFLLYFLVYSGSPSNAYLHSNANSNYMGGRYGGTVGTGSGYRGGKMPEPVYRSTREQDNVYASDHAERPKIDRNKYHNTRDDFTQEYENRESRYDGNGNGRNRNGNYGNRRNHGRNSNYGYETSYGLSWPLWTAIIAGAYKLPPYFPDILGAQYARPFFGMNVSSFIMLLNMFNSSIRGRGRGSRGGGFGSVAGLFGRRRY